MQFTIFQTILFYCGILVASICLSFISFKFLGDKRDYDERQIEVRAKGFKIGYSLLAAIEILFSLIDYFGNKLPYSFVAIQFTVVFIVAVIIQHYLLWKNALWSLTTNRVKSTVLDLILSSIMIILGIIDRVTSKSDVGITAILSGSLMLILSIEMIVKIRIDAREVDEE